METSTVRSSYNAQLICSRLTPSSRTLDTALTVAAGQRFIKNAADNGTDLHLTCRVLAATRVSIRRHARRLEFRYLWRDEHEPLYIDDRWKSSRRPAVLFSLLTPADESVVAACPEENHQGYCLPV